MAAGDADERAVDVIAAGLFGLADGIGNRHCQRADIADDALFHPGAGFNAQADDKDVIGANFANQRTDFMCAGVYANYEIRHTDLPFP